MTNDPPPISEREREILQLVAMGATNQQIAYQLNISVNTVKVHLKKIFAKISVASRTEASMYAVRTGLVLVGDRPATLPAASVAVAEPPDELHEHAPPILPEQLSPDRDPGVLSAVHLSPELLPAEAEPLPIVKEQSLALDTAPQPAPAHRRWVLVGGGVLALLLGIVLTFVFARTTPQVQPVESPISTQPSPSEVSLPATNQRWQSLAALPGGRAGFALTSYGYDGKRYLYVIGGDDGSSVSVQVLRYDMSANVWVGLSAKPTAVSDVQAAVIGNKIYVPGGRLASGAISDRFEVYDPQRDSWRTLQPLPQPRSAYTLSAIEGKLYLIGGWDGQSYHAEVWQYDPDKDAWTSKTPMPTARAFAGAAVIEGQIYIAGGENQRGSLSVNERYIPSEDSGSGTPWTTHAPLPAPSGHIAIGATTNGLLFVVGGTSSDNRLLVYNTAIDSWQPDKIPLGAIRDARVQIVGDKLYVVGGQAQAGLSAQMYAYQALYTVILPFKP